jgi:hypothetical protein
MREFPVAWHNVAGRRAIEGAVRPQRVPERVHEHLNVDARERLRQPAGVELRVVLGCGGSAYCEPELAEYIAGREDWDVATLGLSVNMIGAGFSVPEFRERVEYFVETVATTGRPVFAITVFPHYRDSAVAPRPDDPDPVPYRQALRSAVEAVDRSTLHPIEGRDLLPISGLSADLIHPGDDGFVAIGSSLARRIERRVPDVSMVKYTIGQNG